MRDRFVLILALVALCCITFSETKRTQWFELSSYTFEDYVSEFGKSYADLKEYKLRQHIFQQRLGAIKSHNQDKTKTWKQGVNQLTDRTDEEFRKLLGYKKQWSSAASRAKDTKMVQQTVTDASLPTDVDWRQAGIISAVKDQGQCGSCWTFGTAEIIESHYALKTGQLTALSEQQILDCVPNPQDCGGTGGCGGGTPELAFDQIIAMGGGVASEWTYPYISYFGKDGFTCHSNTTGITAFATISSYTVLPSNQYDPVIQALADTGPLVVNVDASTWHLYESGVFDGCNQTNPDINHVVQLVGYGQDSDGSNPYWLVRNSWSPAWGEDGYIRLMRMPSGPTCGTDIYPQDGTGCNGGPSQVTVCGTCGILYDVSYPVI